MMGFAKDLQDATDHQPGVPKVGFVTRPVGYTDIEGKQVDAEKMDVCARVISVFKCHKACPLTSASSISVAAFLKGSLLYEELGKPEEGKTNVRIGHPSGVMTMYPDLKEENGELVLPGVAVQRTARRIMDGMVYVRK